MTENRRIVLNIIATYGRSLYALVCGLFTARWALMALGEVDYGLYGLVGGLTIFIGFIVSLMSVAVGRYYAFSVGEAKKSVDGLEHCRQWFNTALLLHTVIPLIVMAVGYPIADYAIRHAWLNIPPDRVTPCLWVLRFVCLSSLVGMMSVPFNAMYQAKQYIAELTIYSFATTTLNVVFLYYMVTHPGFWLTRYALWACIMALLPNVLIAIRAVKIFPECQFNRTYLWDAGRFKQLLNYAGWQFFGNAGVMLRGQGIAILVNLYFGAKVNAAVAVGNSLANHCDSLSASMRGAFSPAITNACGARDFTHMRALAYQTCKIGTLLTLLFAVPLALEIDEVLRLWLKTPPDYTAGLALCILAMIVVDRTQAGPTLAVNATGRIACFQVFVGTLSGVTLLFAWIFIACFGWSVYSVGWAMNLTGIVSACGRVWFARKLVGLSARYWLFKILLPLFVLVVFSLAIGYLPHLWMAPSFARVCVTTAIVEMVLIVCSWFFLLNAEERTFVTNRLQNLKRKVLMKQNLKGREND